jgi:hypothetical protein
MQRLRVLPVFLLFAMAFCSPSTSVGGLVLTVKPGTALQSASLGFAKGAISPYVGFDAVGLKVDVTTDEEQTDTWGWSGYTTRTWERDKTHVEGSAFLLIPHLGLKYQFAQGRKVRPHVYLEYFRALAFVNASGSDESWTRTWQNEVEQDPSYTRDPLDSGKAEDAAKDILAFHGINLGAGAEYYFADEFSLGGEYGLRLIFTSAEYKDSDSDPSELESGWSDSWKVEGSAALRLSYAALTLNFHF